MYTGNHHLTRWMDGTLNVKNGGMRQMERTMLYLECIQFVLAIAMLARGSSAGLAFGPVLVEAKCESEKPVIGHTFQVAG